LTRIARGDIPVIVSHAILSELVKLRRRDLLKAGMVTAASAFLPRSGLAQPTSLIQRKIPLSGENLPVIGIGTARRYEDITDEAQKLPLRETLLQFKELGGKLIDSSPTYGTAEAVVGELSSGLKIREALFLATKVSIQGRDAGIRQMEDSFKRLRTDKIDLIAVHNLRDTETHLRTLRDMKNAGRIRYIGITTSFPRQYDEFERAMKAETLDFIQVDYALDNREAGKRILPLAAERGMAVMINLPFGRGRLFNAVQGQKLPPWASDFDCASWAQFFLKYIVSHPSVTCCIPGTAKVEYVPDNLGAAHGRLPDAAMRRRMETFLEAG
jgi:aryl-alcohol dehydrogenase-like predicted oxidoreductase